MSKKLKLCLALFMALAVLVQYSFTPQALVAYGLENTDKAVQTEETVGNDGQAADKQEATEPAEDAKATEPTESTEATKPADKDKTPAGEEKDAGKQDVKYPAASFSETVGDVKVNMSAPEGALPEGTTVEVKKVAASEIEKAVEKLYEDAKVIKAVDITFKDKDGKEIEPNEKVSVTFESKAFAKLDDAAVVHINDDGKAEDVAKAKVDAKKKEASFKSDEFSVYAVIETVTPRLTVKFMNGNTTIDTMYVKAADTADVAQIIYDPGAGTIPSGQVFKGWTTDQNYTAESTLMTIAQVRSDAMSRAAALSEDGNVTYYAALYKQYTVTYVDADDVTVGTEVAEVPSTQTDATYMVNQGYSTDDSHNFEGWLVADGLSNIVDPSSATSETLFPNETVIKIKGDVKFSVCAPEGHWLVFDENGKGATYNAPQFVESGQVTSDEDLLDMVRNGYTFGGWYKDAACTAGNEFSFGGTINETTTIYAKWNPKATANYVVLIWKQNVAGDGYDFVESVTVSNAAVGSTPTAVNANTGIVAGATYRGETGFSYKSTDQASKTVATEGNTVVNVYWDRNTITFNFNLYEETYTATTGTSGTQYGLVGGEYVELTYYNGRWYYYNRGWQTYNSTRYTRSSSWSVYKTMSGLYGSTLTANNYTWPTEYDWYSSYNAQNQPNGTRTTFLDAFLPTSTDTTVEFYGTTPSGSNHIYFYKQNANGSGYTLANTVNTNATGFNLSDKYNGFKCVAWNSSNNTSNWHEVGELMNQNGNFYYDADPSQSGYQTASIGNNGLHVYFDRLSYPILFYDGAYVDGNNNPIAEITHGEWKDVQNVTYGADLTSYNKGGANYYEPPAPAGYVFEGWYIDDACTHPYTFSTMPEGGLTVYAKWRQIQYRVFLHPNAGTDPTLDWGSESQEMNFRVAYGGKVSVPDGVRTGYEFYGWYTDEACTQVFTANTVLNESTVTTTYDKSTHMTDHMDKWGNVSGDADHSGPWNSDAVGYNGGDRFWIQKEFNLYAK